jgi:hypothetical protein
MELESDQALQDAVLSIYHAVTHSFIGTGAVKIIENHTGKAYLQVVQMMQVGMPGQQQPGAQPQQQPAPPAQQP